jgi:NTP pyrophosphatase (non-canonical NTP hydrolase)
MTNELITAVLQWGQDKGITGPHGTGTITRQLQKTLEEIRETDQAVRDYARAEAEASQAHALAEIKDGIGDVLVTLILVCEMNNSDFRKLYLNKGFPLFDSPTEDIDLLYSSFVRLAVSFDMETVAHMVCHLENLAASFNLTLTECLQAAYDVISKRTGKMRDGGFVKDSVEATRADNEA